MKDINECELSINTCKQTEKCINTEGAFQCYQVIRCDIGFEIYAGSSECRGRVFLLNFESI